MVKKNFIGVMTPCVATALFMSGIMFTGCSKDDDFEDWDEETVQTLAEQRMTRSAENNNNEKPEDKINIKTHIVTFKASFKFSHRKQSDIYGESELEVTIVTDTLDNYLRYESHEKSDENTTIADINVYQLREDYYQIIVTASYTWDAEYQNSQYVHYAGTTE